MGERLNLDEVVVVNVRLLSEGKVEALLRVSKRDYDRLLGDHAGMHYSIAGQEDASTTQD